MKKILISSLTLLLLLTVVFIACKKSSDTLTTTTNPLSARIESTTEVDREFNFLVFRTVEDYERLYNQFISSRHGEIREFLHSIEFISMGDELFASISNDEMVTKEQAVHYLLNTKGVIKIQDLIMKPADETEANNDWKYLLTVKSANFNGDVYDNLAQNIYLSSSMNRFAAGIDVPEGLFNFTDANPIGFDNYDVGNAQGRPFIGSVSTCVESDCTWPDGHTGKCCFRETKKYIVILVSTGHGENDGAHYGTCAQNPEHPTR